MQACAHAIHKRLEKKTQTDQADRKTTDTSHTSSFSTAHGLDPRGQMRPWSGMTLCGRVGGNRTVLYDQNDTYVHRSRLDLHCGRVGGNRTVCTTKMIRTYTDPAWICRCTDPAWICTCTDPAWICTCTDPAPLTTQG